MAFALAMARFLGDDLSRRAWWRAAELDYLTLEYLAELSMSILRSTAGKIRLTVMRRIFSKC